MMVRHRPRHPVEEPLMFDTQVINVAIGLVFCFAATALAASTVTEAIASLLKLRAGTLVAGVQELLNDSDFSGLARQVYNHALVNPQGSGALGTGAPRGGPSYIRAGHFASALVDVLQKVPGDVATMKSTIDALPDPQLRQLLQGMVVRAQGDVDRLHAQIADWFDAGMDRVSGGYKRRAQLVSFLAALLLAVTINVDATHVVTTLWRNPALARALATEVAPMAQGTPEVKAAIAQLETLPVGPGLLAACDTHEWVCVAGHGVSGYNLLGWLITAVASVFGAPFWFDLLQKLVQLRGSGPKPPAPAKAADGA
jgi:hypothetical protein